MGKETEKILVIHDWHNGYTCTCCEKSGTNILNCFNTRKEAEEWIIKQKAERAANKELGRDVSYIPYNFKIVEIIWSEESGESLGQEFERKVLIATQEEKERLEKEEKKSLPI